MEWHQYPTPITDPDTGCIRWSGPHLASGHGRLSGPTRLAHREAWELINGPIPARGIIDHVWDRGCRHRDCVNVDHLELVDNTENVRRAVAARGGKRSWKDTDHPERAGYGGTRSKETPLPPWRRAYLRAMSKINDHDLENPS